MRRFEHAVSVEEANELVKEAEKEGDVLKDQNISVPEEGVVSIILVFETEVNAYCPDCELETLYEAKEEYEEDYFCLNCGELFTEDEVEA